MRVWKIVVIALLLLAIPAYIGMVKAAPVAVSSTCENEAESEPTQATDRIGFCSDIKASVERSYYFGLLRLPVNRAGVNIDTVNRLFLPFLAGLALLVWKL